MSATSVLKTAMLRVVTRKRLPQMVRKVESWRMPWDSSQVKRE